MDINSKLKSLSPEVKKNFEKTIEQLKKHIDILYELATIDEKTGVYNHKFFKTISEREIDKAKREIEPLSLIIIDLDHFKKINDNYGHLIGDLILKRVGFVLKENTRKYDLVSRFGGEEFIVLFPNTNLSRAKKVSERLRRKIQEDKYLSAYNLTMSGGLCEYKKNDTISRMKKRADKALYIAKNKGRNLIQTK